MTSAVRLHRRNGASRTPRGGFPPRRSSNSGKIIHVGLFKDLRASPPLLFGPILDPRAPRDGLRPKQVPPQKWQSQEGGPPLCFTPQGWRLRDVRPNMHHMGQTACRTDTLLFQKLVLIYANLFSAIRANMFSMGPISVSMRPQAPRQFMVMTRQSFAHLHQLFRSPYLRSSLPPSTWP